MLRNLISPVDSHKSRRRPQRHRRLNLELLEDRCLLATFTVINLNDAGAGSLRQAINSANSNGNPSVVDSIVFDSVLAGGIIKLTSTLPNITQSVNVTGPTSNRADLTLDGQNLSGVASGFLVNPTASSVTISNLTMTRGNIVGGAVHNGGAAVVNAGPNTTLQNVAVTNNASDAGGGIFNNDSSTLIIINSTVNGNSSAGDGGGIVNNFGATLTVSNSTVNGNTAGPGGEGGGIFNNTNATLTVSNSTVSGNSASFGSGGGILNSNGATLIVSDSTVSGNTVMGTGGGIAATGTATIRGSAIWGNRAARGGGIDLSGFATTATILNSTLAYSIATGPEGGGAISTQMSSLTVVNSTIVGNADTSNAAEGAGGVSKSEGGTLIVRTTIIAGNSAGPGSANHNVQLSDLNENLNNFIGGDPKLGPLADNGGPTLTMLPFANSPVIDAGSNSHPNLFALTTDQRGAGFPRIVDGDGDGTAIVDIGAVEAPKSTATGRPTKFFVVNSAATDKLFRYDINGALTGSQNLESTNTSPWGVHVNADASRRWVINGAKTVFLYNGSGALLGKWSANGLSGKPRGITVVGVDVYIVDNTADRVFVYEGQAARTSGSANPTRSFALAAANTEPQGITSNGLRLWVVDNQIGTARDKVFRYELNGPARGSWELDNGNKQPTGITADPSGQSKTLWVVDRGSKKIFQYDNAVGFNSGTKSAQAKLALAASNTNPQGIADPPVANDFSETASTTSSNNKFNSTPRSRTTPHHALDAAIASLYGTKSLEDRPIHTAFRTPIPAKTVSDSPSSDKSPNLDANRTDGFDLRRSLKESRDGIEPKQDDTHEPTIELDLLSQVLARLDRADLNSVD